MKSNVWPILKREYKTRIMTKGFWISTALFPILAFAITIVPSRLAMKTKLSREPIVVVDAVGGFFPVLKNVAERDKTDIASRPPLQEEPLAGRQLSEVRRSLNDRAQRGEIQGYVVVDRQTVDSYKLVFYARNPSGALTNDWLASSLAEALRRYRIRQLGIGDQRIEEVVGGVDFDVEKATNDPKAKQSGVTAIYMTVGLVMFIYFALIFYGVYVLRGVLEEKSNRIVEVIVSSVRPFDLMLGKIIGVGAVGLTQIAIWITCAVLLSAPQLAGFLAISKEALPSLSTMTIVGFPLFFVLGYFLFATIYAGIGSMFNSEEDAQQMVSIASMLLVVPMIMLGPVMRNPGGTTATILSMIPFFSPILMYLRITVQQPPMWQIALSVALLVVTIIVMVWLVAKVYRIGILMYGKKPTIPELIRWLRYT